MDAKTRRIKEMQAVVIKAHTSHGATKGAARRTVAKLDLKTLRREYRFVQSHS